MDKKGLLALILSILIIMAYPYYLKHIMPQKNEPVMTSEQQTYETSASIQEKSAEKTEEAPAEIRDENYFVIENDKIRVTVSNYNARVVEIIAKNGDGEEAHEAILFSENKQDKSAITVRVVSKNDAIEIACNSIFYKGLYNDGENQITFLSPPIGNVVIKKYFRLDDNKSAIYLNTEITNQSDYEEYIGIEEIVKLNGIVEKNKKASRYDKAMIRGMVKSNDHYEITKSKQIFKEGFAFSEKVDWVSIESKYYTSITRPEYEAYHTTITGDTEEIISAKVTSDTEALSSGESKNFKSYVYVGPKIYSVLKGYNDGFEHIIAHGFWGGLRILLLTILLFLYKIVHNYGVSIILLTVMIKIVFAPLTHKSFKSMKKMQELQPQMKEIQEKHKGDPQRLNKEVMELYKKHKANPLGGCFPLLLQMPVFIILYQLLSRSVELRGAPFIFWIKDLSKPDRMFTFPFSLPILGDSFNLLPILMLLSMVLQQKLTPSTATSKDQERAMLLMPIVFGFLFYGMPSGLVLYWLVNNLLTIGQQVWIRRSAQTQ